MTNSDESGASTVASECSEPRNLMKGDAASRLERLSRVVSGGRLYETNSGHQRSSQTQPPSDPAQES